MLIWGCYVYHCGRMLFISLRRFGGLVGDFAVIKKGVRGSVGGSLALLLAAVIWGLTFVAQSAAMDDLQPFTFYAARSLLGAAVLLPVAVFTHRRSAAKRASDRGYFRILMRGGLVCGVIMAASALFQQFGIIYTTVGKASFITTLYIVFVPLLYGLSGKKIAVSVWGGVLLAAVGMYLLCMNGSAALQKGDLLVLVCAFAFAFHILAVDYYCLRVDPVTLSCVQFFVAGLISLILMFIFERPQWSSVMAAAGPIVYAGVMSSGVAFTLQIIGQRSVNPAVAALIMSLEAVFGAVGGWLILKEVMSARELAGAGLMLLAVILAQLSLFRKNRSEG